MRLPQPSAGFAWVELPPGPALVCEALEAVAPHFYTTRDWSLGSEPAEQREAAWAVLARAAGVEPGELVRVNQVHGADVLIKRGRAAGTDRPAAAVAARSDADVIISNDTSSLLAVQTADCIPLLIADRRTGAVAAAHAGWRGLASGVPRVAVESLTREFGSDPRDLIVAIGPSIGACCYEVGHDVRESFARGGFERDLGRWFLDTPQPTRQNPSMPALPPHRRANHWFFDGWTAAREQLIRAGVPGSQIHGANLCTASHASLCSYRRDGGTAGRMAAAIRRR
jgi:polyphenol oxidase